MARPRSEMDDLMDALSELTKASARLHEIPANRGSRTKRSLVVKARKDADAARASTQALISAQIEALRPVG